MKISFSFLLAVLWRSYIPWPLHRFFPAEGHRAAASLCSCREQRPYTSLSEGMQSWDRAADTASKALDVIVHLAAAHAAPIFHHRQFPDPSSSTATHIPAAGRGSLTTTFLHQAGQDILGVCISWIWTKADIKTCLCFCVGQNPTETGVLVKSHEPSNANLQVLRSRLQLLQACSPFILTAWCWPSTGRSLSFNCSPSTLSPKMTLQPVPLFLPFHLHGSIHALNSSCAAVLLGDWEKRSKSMEGGASTRAGNTLP